MKEVLDKVRLEYRDEYEIFINKMERETDEVRIVMVVLVVLMVMVLMVMVFMVMVEMVMVLMTEGLSISAVELYYLADVGPAGEDGRSRPLLRPAGAGEDEELPGQDLRPPG